MKGINKKIVVIPFNIPWEWSTDYTNQTAVELAKKGNVVFCYLWSDPTYIKDTVLKGKFPKFITKKNSNLYLIKPWHIIPFKRFDLVNKINNFINAVLLKFLVLTLSRVKKISSIIFWIFDPNTYFLYKYFKDNSYLVYDCVDYFPGAVLPKFKKETQINEEKLLSKADLVVANSTVLKKYLSKYRKDVYLVPQGFRLDKFKNAKTVTHLSIKINKRPLIGYVGALNKRLDYELLYDLATKHPEWDFALWGPILEKNEFSSSKLRLFNKLFKLKNVIRGQSPKEDIPAIIKQFDVCMIPYDMTQDFNKYCYPMKIFEYFYMGKPIVSSNIIELRRFPGIIKIANNLKDWENILKRLVNMKWPQNLKKIQKKLAIQNSWERKICLILERINTLP
jgi:hypothetical protein